MLVFRCFTNSPPITNTDNNQGSQIFSEVELLGEKSGKTQRIKILDENGTERKGRESIVNDLKPERPQTYPVKYPNAM